MLPAQQSLALLGQRALAEAQVAAAVAAAVAGVQVAATGAAAASRAQEMVCGRTCTVSTFKMLRTKFPGEHCISDCIEGR